MNGGPATANEVRNREKGPKQKFLGMESAIEDILTNNLSGERSARYFR